MFCSFNLNGLSRETPSILFLRLIWDSKIYTLTEAPVKIMFDTISFFHYYICEFYVVFAWYSLTLVLGALVNIVTRARDDRSGVRILHFFISERPDWLWGPTSLLFNGDRRYTDRGVKLPPSSAEDRIEELLPAFSFYALMAWSGSTLPYSPLALVTCWLASSQQRCLS